MMHIFEMGSGGMIDTLSFKKIGSGLRKLLEGGIHTDSEVIS
jgi:hypothetical protein